MDLIKKIDMIVDTTVTGDVAQNKTKGNVDVVGGKCPEGMHYCKKRKTCVPDTNEAGDMRKWKNFEKVVKKEIDPNWDGNLTGDVYSKLSKKALKLYKEYFNSIQEAVVAAAVVGSGQTRVWGNHFNLIDALETKEKVVDKEDDKAKENLGRPDLKFDSLLGAYVPKTDTYVDDTQMENDDE